MKNKTWLFGGAAAIAILAGGYALAQSHGRGGFEGMGGIHQQMQGMHGESGNGGRQGRGSDNDRGNDRHGQMQGGRMQGMHGQSGGQANDSARGNGEHGQMRGMMGGKGGMSDHSGHDQRGNGQRGEGPRGQQGNAGPGGLGQFDPAALDSRKAEIGIKPEQEAVWTKYVTTVKSTAETLKTRRDQMDHDAVQKMAPADRFAFVSAQREQAQKEFETVNTAAKELLATLDDAQKGKARNLPGLGEPGSRSAMNGEHGNMNGEHHRR